MKFELEEYHRNVSNQELISDLKRVAKQINQNFVTREQQDENGKYHSATYIRRFGSWFDALTMAGLEKTRTPMNLPEEELFKNLQEVWVKLGRQPHYQDILKPFSKYSVGTYEYRFGTFRKALEKFVAYINKDENYSKTNLPKENVRKIGKVHRTKRGINWRLRFLVMRRDNFKCKNCGRSPASDPLIILHVDHIKPWASGGETIQENLQTLCSVCNIGKSNLE